MDSHVIFLDPDDDIVSIKDRLDWTDQPRLLLVLPTSGRVLAEKLDLVLLRRHADLLDKEVGLVTRDGEVTGPAREVGLPVFRSTRAAAHRRARREWWRSRRTPLPGVDAPAVPTLDPADRAEVRRRLAPLPAWRVWLLRYAAILIFFLTVSLLLVAAAYAVPSATMTFRPLVEPAQVSQVITADPALQAVDYAAGAIPARQLAVTVSWQATIDTTGITDVPDAPARGQVIFANRLDQPVTVPAGTRVSASGGTPVIFQTLEAVDVPGAVGSTAEATIVAVEPGPQGNVAANVVNRLEGPLALQLDVRNLEPIDGGTLRQVRSVTAEDQARLRAQVEQFLAALATSEMEALLEPDEFLAEESVRIARVLDESASRFVDERAGQVTLAMRAEVVGTAVDPTQAHGLLYQALAAAVAGDFELAPASLQFRRGSVEGVDESGRVTFSMTGAGLIAARLALAEVVVATAGQPADEAAVYLQARLPLRDTPVIRVQPPWFKRVPYLPARIQTRIVAADGP